MDFPSPPSSVGNMSFVIHSCKVDKLLPCKIIRSRVFSLRNGLMTANAASTYQGCPTKCMALNRIGKQSCEKIN